MTKPGKPETLTADESPSWMTPYKLLTVGYRKPSGSFAKCIHSSLQWHNQTVNIWSHVLASLYFVYKSFYQHSDVDQQGHFGHNVDETLYVVVCVLYACVFGFSALFHLFSNHSKNVRRWFFLLDMFGVFGGLWAVILMNAMMLEHETIFLEKNMLYFLFTVTSFGCILYMAFKGIENIKLKVLTGTAILSFHLRTAILHTVQHSDVVRQSKLKLLWTGHFLSLVLAGLVVNFKVPETFLPLKTADFLGHSHQLFHIFTFMASYFNMRIFEEC